MAEQLISFKKNGYLYRLTLDLEGGWENIQNQQAPIKLAVHREPVEGQRGDPITFSAVVTLQYQEEGNTKIAISINGLPEIWFDELPPLDDEEAWYQFIQEFVQKALNHATEKFAEKLWQEAVDTGVEQVIDGIPSLFFGDPVIGCLFRSGLSTLVGQVLRCRRRVENARNAEAWLRSMLSCLRNNLRNMGFTAFKRTVICLARAGF